MRKKLISIGVPCYNEELNVIPCYQALKKVASQIKNCNFEFLFVDNGSPDKTKEKIKQIAKKDKRVLGIFLSRNFGPESSNNACLDNATGDAFIGFPCDLQDPPNLINKLISKWEQGNSDIVVAIYRKNQDNLITLFLRKNFYMLFRKISNIDIPINAVGTGLLNKKALMAMRSLPEKYRFFRGLRAWIGFKSTKVYYDRKKRKRGKSSYSMLDYFRHAERGLFGFSYFILDLMIYASIILVIISFIFLIGYLLTVFIFGNPIQASIPIMLAIVFFGGFQLLAISIIGKYLQVVVEETKNRPPYIIESFVNATPVN